MMVFHPVSEMNPFFPEPAGNIHKEEVPFLGLQVAEVRECSKVHYFDSKDRLPLWQERFGLDIRKSSSFRGCLGTEQTPQGMVTALRLPELQECLGDALREGQAGIFCVVLFGARHWTGWSLFYLWFHLRQHRDCWSQFGCPGTAAPWHQSGGAGIADAEFSLMVLKKWKEGGSASFAASRFNIFKNNSFSVSVSQHLSASALLKLWCIPTQHWIISILLVMDHKLREL